jgi:hypothetical protein
MPRAHVLALVTLACATPEPSAPQLQPHEPAPTDTSSKTPPRDVARAQSSETTATADESAPGQADLDRLRALEKTRVLYEQFLERADGRDEFADAISRARERLDDVQQEMDFLKQGIAERRLRELGGNEQ